MSIDWFTFIAQILNFFLLIWLLKRFMFAPVLAAIDSREKQISDQVATAKAESELAANERKLLSAKAVELEAHRESIMDNAEKEAAALRIKAFEETRGEISTLKEQAQKALELEERSLREELLRTIEREVLAISGKVLIDMANTQIEERMCDLFIERLCALTEEEKRTLDPENTEDESTIIVRSSFSIVPERQVLLQQAIEENLSTKKRIKFTTAPEIIAGVELHLRDFQISWSVASYLASISSKLDELTKMGNTSASSETHHET